MKKQVEVKIGPFATFNDRKIVIATQKYIVPWSIALFGYSFPKLQTIDTYREMMIAVIGRRTTFAQPSRLREGGESVSGSIRRLVEEDQACCRYVLLCHAYVLLLLISMA